MEDRRLLSVAPLPFGPSYETAADDVGFTIDVNGVKAAGDRFIVRFTDEVAGMAGFSAAANAPDGTLVRELSIINGAVVELDAADADLLGTIAKWESLASVAYAEPDYIVETLQTFPNDPSFSSLWGLHNTGQTGGTPDADIDAPEAWDIFTGSSNVVLASIDTGVDYNHEDLSANMWKNMAEFNGTTGVDDDGNGYIDDIYGIDTYNADSDPWDDHGHGTHTSGTMAGIGNNAVGVAGVNWDAQIMSLKFLSGAGSGSTAGAIEAIQYMTNMKTTYGVNVVVSNNSWGGGAFSQALEDTIAASNAAGILFVAAAGNNSTDNDVSPHYPSNYPLPGIIAVTATDHNDAQFYNYGLTSVDIGAPGRSIYSTVPGGYQGGWNGTSMATPHVAGAAAMLMAYDPTATLADIKAAIMDGGDPITSLAGITVSGARLNLYGSLQEMGLVVAGSSPAAGEVVFSPPTDYVIDFSGVYDPTSVAAADLTVNAIAAGGFVLTDADTITFTFAASPVTVEGAQTMDIAAGAITRLSDAAPVTAWNATFRYDLVPMVVTSTVPADGTTVTLPFTTLRVNFNEVFDPASVGADDLILSQGSVFGFGHDSTNWVVYTLEGITTEETLTVDIPAGALTDGAGNPMLAYSGSFPLDFDTVPYPVPLEAKDPLGSLIYDPSVAGVIGIPGDTDSFTIDLDDGQTVTVVLDPDATLQQNLYALDASATNLVVLDPTTGVVLSTVPVTNQERLFGGLTSDALRDLYSVDGYNDTFEDRLFRIDRTTGSGTVVGNTGFNWNFRFVEYNPSNGVLYGGQDNELYTFDPTTGAATLVASIVGTGLDQATALAIDSAGNAYVTDINDTGLYSLNLSNGQATHLGDLAPGGYASYEDLAFNSNGELYGAHQAAEVHIIDIATVQANLQFSGSYDGLTFVTEGLRPSVELFDPSSLSIGSATADAPDEDAVLQTVATTGAGTYTVKVGGAGGTTGAYTAQIVLNAAVEEESHDGPTNDDYLSGQNINASFISPGGGSAERGAVLGTGDGGGVGLGPDGFGYEAIPLVPEFEDISATGTGVLAGADDSYVTLTDAQLGDFQFDFYGTTYVDLYVSSNGLITFGSGTASLGNTDLTLSPSQATIATLWDDLELFSGGTVYWDVRGSGTDERLIIQWDNIHYYAGSPSSITFQAVLKESDDSIQLNYLDLDGGGVSRDEGAQATAGIKDAGTQGANRLLISYNAGPNAYLGTGRSTLIGVGVLEDPTPDYFSFDLLAGQSSTLALTDLTGGDGTLELRDGGDNLLALAAGAANVDQVINNFVAASTGTYYARVSGSSADYSLVVTRDADFDTETNDDLAEAQDITLDGTALGHVGPGDGGPTPLPIPASKGDISGNSGESQTGLTAAKVSAFFSSARDTGAGPDGTGVGRIETPLAPGSEVYVLDDGTHENSIGLTGGGDVLWLNVFDALPGFESITSIALAWGSMSGGGPSTVLLYEDPNDDGDPSDAVLLTTANTVVTDPDTDLFTTVPITPTEVSGKFFIGGLVRSHAAGQFPSSLDETSSAGKSWIVGNTTPGGFDINDLMNNDVPPAQIDTLGLPGNWLLRADGTAATDEDFYSFEALTGDSLAVTTSTPMAGPGEFVNVLDAAVELFDPTGAAVAFDSSGSLAHTAARDGTYTLRVLAENDTEGEYLLQVTGYNGPMLPFEVVATDPADGQYLPVSPPTLTVDFSDTMLLSSLAAADLLIDGSPSALGMTVSDGNTVVFDLPASLAEGLHTVSIAAGAIQDIQGTPIVAYTGEFYVDLSGPRVIDSSIQEAEVVPAGTLTYTAGFDEELDATALDSADVQLVGLVSGSHTPTVFNYNYNSGAGSSVLTLQFDNLPDDSYTLTLLSGDGQFEDLVGWDLDGETPAWPIPPNTSGDGTPGGNFVVNFAGDVDVAGYPVPLVAKDPPGSLIYDPAAAGAIGIPGDTDSYTIDLDAGQTITVVAETDSSLDLILVLKDPSDSTVATVDATGIGQDEVILTYGPTIAGTYTVVVSGHHTDLMGISNTGILYDVDPLTGVAGNPRGTGVNGTIGIATGAGGMLYTLTHFNGSPSPNSLYSIDPVTASATLVGATGLASISQGDLDFDPTTGLLYGLEDLSGSLLFTVDVATGVATPVGAVGITSPDAMAFDDSGILYVLGTYNDELLVVDKATGSTISTTPLSLDIGQIAGMDFNPATGTLYVVDGIPGTNTLYSLDPSTGVLTLIGPTGAPGNGLVGLEFVTLPSDYGDYTAQVILNAAVEMERHDGPANDDYLSAQALGASFISLGGGLAERGAVLGTGDGGGGFAESQTQYDNAFVPNVLTYDFTGAPTPTGDGTLDVSAIADLDLSSEYLTLSAEGLFSMDLFVTGGLQMSLVSTVVPISLAQLLTLAADGTVTFTVTPSSSVNNLTGTEELTLDLQYPASAGGPDYFSFDLLAGQSSTLALTDLTGSGGTLELRDASDNLLAAAVGAANVDQVINNYVAPSAGTYYAQVSGSNADYSLVVTRDTDFDTEANNEFATAQDISTMGGALGHVKGASGTNSPLLDNAARGGATNWDGPAVPDRDLAPTPSITLPYNSDLTFDEAMALFGAGVAQAQWESGQEAVQPLESSIVGPLPILQEFPGPGATGFTPPDPIAAAGPEQIVAMVNTDIGIYDKATGTELFRQPAQAFFAGVGSTTYVFDPWVLFDADTGRFFLIGIDLASNTQSNVFLAVSTDATPTSGADWYKYKIDFTHDGSGGLGSGAHFPDYPKMGVDQDAIYISGNYFPIASGSGVYAGITAFQKTPLLTGAPLNMVYEEHFTGFSVFPMTQYGLAPAEYFAESSTGGGSSLTIHAVANVLTTPVRTTTAITVPSYAFPNDVPQLGGGLGADAIDARVMTGVWRDGSMWFAHPIEDPAIGDGEAVARWYEVATPSISLTQSGNVDPGPGVHAWMPAIAVDGGGNMGIGFSIGGPAMYFGAGFTGRLASDPPGDTILPVTTLVDGLSHYDTGGRNRWGDYSGLSIDPADDATFWVFNEYASATANVWATHVGAFQLAAPVDDDWYQFAVNAGDPITLETFTPADGPFELVNALDPAIELYAPDGALVLADDNSAADGRNALIAGQVATQTGSYRVRLSGVNSQGEYFLSLDLGASNAGNPPPYVVDADPDDGQVVDTFPLTYTLDFSESILIPSVQAGDLLIGGFAALSKNPVDGDTFEFEIDPAANIGDGIYLVVLAQGVVTDLQGVGNVAFGGSFTLDTTGPRVIGSSVQEGDVVSLLPGGGLVYTATFDEDLMTTASARRGLYAPGADDILLFEARTGQYFTPTSVAYDSGSDTFTASYDGLPEGDYTLTLISGDNAFEDVVGNDLDGETPAWPIPPNVSGDGTAGGDFLVNFTFDAVQSEANAFERLAPLGGLMSESVGNTGLINFPGDQDDFTFFAEAGQTIAAAVYPDESAATMSIELVGLAGPFVSPGPGEPAVLPPQLAPADGAYAVRVSADTTGTYELRIGKDLIAEVVDTGRNNPLDVDDSFVNLGSGRYGVLGTSEGQEVTLDSLVWGVQPANGLIVLLDPATGAVLHSINAPDALLSTHTEIGLSIAEGGNSLLYVNSDASPGLLYRLDPFTGAVLSIETTAVNVNDGLGFETLTQSGATIYEANMDTDPGWTLEGQWAYGVPTGGGSHNLDPSSGNTGANVIGYNLSGDYANGIPVYYTTTPAMDASSYADVSLSFYRWLGVESSSYDHASIQVSNNGSTWTTVWDHVGSAISDSSWTLQTFDISAVAAGQSTVYVRWSMGPTDGSVTYPGWNIDDVVVTGTLASPPGIYLGRDMVQVTRQDAFSGPEVTHLSAVQPSGAVGGDDAGRQFAYVPGTGSIVEFDPRVVETIINTFSAPAAGIEGLAFDGTSLFASEGGNLYTLNPAAGTVLGTVSVTGGGLYGLGALGSGGGGVFLLPEIDEYRLDLTGKAGQPIDVVLAGQDGVDFSGELLELRDSSGNLLATGDANPLGVPDPPGEATNYDLAILDFTVPSDGLYTLRFTSTVSGDYGIVVTDPLIFDSEPNDATTDPLRSLDDAGAALGYLSGPNTSGGLLTIPASDGNFPRGTAGPSIGVAPVQQASGNPAAGDPAILAAYSSYGWEAFNNILAEFDVDAPAVLNTAAPLTLTTYAGDFDNSGDFSVVYAIDDTASTLVSIDTTTGAVTTIGPTTSFGGESWAGMAADPTSGLMYASSTNASVSSLYTIDLSTGAATRIGAITNSPGMIALAVDDTGQAYGYDITNDSLIRIDKATGAGTIVGSLGFDANYAQGMDFDEESGQLYLAAYNNSVGLAELRIADRTTGATTLVGVLGSTTPGGSTEVTWMGVAAGGGSDVGDLYEITLAAGEQLVVHTETPFDRPDNSPLNELDPALCLYDPLGALLLCDSNSEDGKNARIDYLATGAGAYTIEVSAEQGTGDYLLKTGPDYGDAPSPYPTLWADNGARHIATGPRLGTNRDTEPDGQPTAAADGDDTNGTPDDEDGVVLPVLAASTFNSTTPSVTVDLQNADAVGNYLDAWIDFNQDGDWDDSGEQVFTNYNLGTSNGVQSPKFTVPQDTGGNIVYGTTYARFRLSTAGGLLPTGVAGDGEVEDYQVQITGLAAWYQLDGNGDDSADAHDGTVNGAIPAPDRFGDPNSAMLFDGTDDYIAIADDPDLRPTTAMTVVAWFKPNSFNPVGSYSWPAILKKVNDVEQSGYTIEIGQLYEGTPKVAFIVSSADGPVSAGSFPVEARPLETDPWYFLAGTYEYDVLIDQSTLTTFFGDEELGVLQSQSTVFSGPIRHSTLELNIGRDNYNTNPASNRYFNGPIDDVRIYDGALSEGEILGLYTGMTAWWQLDGNGDDSIDDHDGTVFGGPVITPDRFGRADSGMYFDGVDDYIAIDDDPNLRPTAARPDELDLSPTTAMTLMAWFKPNSFNPVGSYSWPAILKKVNDAEQSGYTIEIGQVYEGTPKVSFSVFSAAGPESPGSFPVEARPEEIDPWYFLAGTYEYDVLIDQSTLTTFFGDEDDGVFESQSTVFSGPIRHSTLDLNIGRDNYNTLEDRYFNGPIDDVRIYSRALSGGEIFALFTGVDFGDAPAPYPTLLADNGARHLATGPRLGTNRDTELDGQPTGGADGDDINGVPDDEDGVSFPAALVPGDPAAPVDIDMTGSAVGGLLNAWIDLNGDGDWLDAGEQIFADQSLTAGAVNNLTFPIPYEAGVTYGTTYARFRVDTAGGLLPTGPALDGEVEDYTVDLVPAAIADRRIFYDNSHWDGGTAGPNTSGGPAGNGDDGAIAPDKTPLLPLQTATFANYTSYTRGLNGIMVDVQGLANPAGIDAADFIFRVGNDAAPGGWLAPPSAPTNVDVRPGAGDDGSDRVTIIWADSTIRNQWLQVTVLANTDTGLVQDEVFYAGNLTGDTDGNFVVNIADLYAVYLAMGPGAAIDSPWDIDRSGIVNIADMYAVYLNLNSTLHEFTAPAAILQSIDSVFDEDPSWAMELIWLDELYGTSADSEEEEDEPLEANAVDDVYAEYDEE